MKNRPSNSHQLAKCVIALLLVALLQGCATSSSNVPSNPEDAANLQRLTGDWISVEAELHQPPGYSSSTEPVTNPGSHFHLAMSGSSIIVTTVQDRDVPQANILRGETHQIGWIHLQGRRIVGTTGGKPWDTLAGIVNEDFTEIYFKREAHAEGEYSYMRDTLRRMR
jgi:hypothetical protein